MLVKRRVFSHFLSVLMRSSVPTSHLDMHSVMDIPEIILLIGGSLPRHSLATCLRVCKSWHQLLAPLLYKAVSCLYLPTPSIEGMARHAEHIRHLTLQLYKQANLMDDGIPVFLSTHRSSAVASIL